MVIAAPTESLRFDILLAVCPVSCPGRDTRVVVAEVGLPCQPVPASWRRWCSCVSPCQRRGGSGAPVSARASVVAEVVLLCQPVPVSWRRWCSCVSPCQRQVCCRLLRLQYSQQLARIGVGAADRSVQTTVPTFDGVVSSRGGCMDVPHTWWKITMQPRVLVVVE